MIGDYQQRCQKRVDRCLDTLFTPPRSQLERLYQAMRYSVMNGGKRVRPLLVYAACEALEGDSAQADGAACAVELIHAYSLVHDDLPAMDDDALRRGQPTVHIAFDEATAILAGDALQALAFEVLAGSDLSSDARIAQVRELASASGAAGMCAGQSLDMQGRADDVVALEHLHSLKTGALIRAAVRLGALAAESDPATRVLLDGFADQLGLAFQIRDDLLDVEGEAAQLGKTAGKDAAQGKATYVHLLGADAARDRLQSLAAGMQQALASLDQRADALRSLAAFAIARSH